MGDRLAEARPPWRVVWTREAERYFHRVQPKTQARILKALQTLAVDPLGSSHVKRLHGELEGLHRFRLGDLRMVFRLLPLDREIRIIAIASRGDVY